jgi:hypothetical protein
MKDLTDPTPAEDMIEIRDFAFLKTANYAEKLDREMKTRAQGAAEEEPREKVKTTAVRGSASMGTGVTIKGRCAVWCSEGATAGLLMRSWRIVVCEDNRRRRRRVQYNCALSLERESGGNRTT